VLFSHAAGVGVFFVTSAKKRLLQFEITNRCLFFTFIGEKETKEEKNTRTDAWQKKVGCGGRSRAKALFQWSL